MIMFVKIGSTHEDIEMSMTNVRCSSVKIHLACTFLLLLYFGATPTCFGQKPLNLGATKRRDVYIAGFFPFGKHVQESHLGRGVMPSVKLAVDHINENPAILRNYRLHMWWNDTACNAAVGVKAFFDMMHSGPHKVMLFGAACTHVTDPIAKASKHWRLTQLSYADTHPMFSSNTFPNFFRVVPSENAFNAPRVSLLLQFNWTRVGTIYQNEPRFALAHNRLVADLDGYKLEVVETQSFATEVTSALEKLRDKDVRIILGNFNEMWARQIFCEAYRLHMFGRKYQWVIMGTYAEKWWMLPGGGCKASELAEALQGAILTDLLPLSTSQQITVAGITPDEYQVEYDARRGDEYSRFHGYTYDGIWAVALAIQHVARRIRHYRRNETMADFRYRDELWERLFLEALRNTSFEGVTGPVRFYDNERKAYILLKQFQNGNEIKIGEYDGITGTLDLMRGNSLVWRGKSPPKDRTLHLIEHSTVNLTIYGILASTASIGIVMAATFLAINIRYRNQRYIKMSSPHLNNLIIVGCMLTYSSVIFLGLDSQLSSVHAFPYICTARAWLLMVGFSLAFGSMFSKTWRVHSIFTDVKLNKKVIKDYQLFMVVGVLVAIDLAIMTTWQVSDPFYRETKHMEPYPHPSSEDIIVIPENEYCKSNRMTIYLGSIYAYKGILMIFGAFLAWETRHVSIPALNDSKYVGMSVYNVVIMCVTGAAISFVLDDKQDAMFIMLSIFIIFCSTATLCLVFLPKLIELRRNPQGAIDKRIRATLRPMSKTRRDSSFSELEERLKEVSTLNHRFRKLLNEKENELQIYLTRLEDDGVEETQTVISRLNLPQDSIIRKDALSMTTDTTDLSLYSMNLLTQQDSGNWKLAPEEIKKKVSDDSRNTLSTDEKPFAQFSISSSETQAKQLKYDEAKTKVAVDAKQASTNRSKTQDFRDGTIASEKTRKTDSSSCHRSSNNQKSAQNMESSHGLMTTKNVSFGTYKEHVRPEQSNLLQPVNCVSKQRQGAVSTALSGRSSLKRRSSAISNDIMHSQHELFEKRRPSAPINSISYISSENVVYAENNLGSLEKAYFIGECSHRRSFAGYRCEKHGGVGHNYTSNNGSLETTTSKKNRHLNNMHNSSLPSVPVTLSSYQSGSGKFDSQTIQRSVSEHTREKSKPKHTFAGCPHKTRRIRECIHSESKLRQQTQIGYVQSTPNVTTIHSGKILTANPRGRGYSKASGTCPKSLIGTVSGSTDNVSKFLGPSSDGEHLEVTILPIFQKLIRERHKSDYGSSIASCPNISIKCDIVEYL